MERIENVFIAKRMLIDNIYRSAKLEGLSVTYAQTIDIIENISTDVVPSAINDIINLKNGWRYILENLDLDLDLALIKNCHNIIGRGMDIPFYEIGEFRRGAVGIGGTTWRPEFPDTEKLHAELMKIKEISSIEDRAIALFCWVMRSQMFRDGNKRVANLVANFELIRNGAGLISVPEQDVPSFKKLLVEYYETNDISALSSFLKEKCYYDDMEFLSRSDRKERCEDRVSVPFLDTLKSMETNADKLSK